MGLLDKLRATVGITTPNRPPAAGLASPWAPPNNLEPVVIADIWPDGAPLPVTRAEAMKVPALARARQLICTTVARLPIYSAAGDARAEEQPRWIDRTDGPISPYHRMLMTVDDLLFYGWSLWAVHRDFDGRVIKADRVPIERWEIDNDTGRVLVGGEPVDSREVCLIPGVHEGILAFGADTVRHARTLLDAVANAAETPAAQVELHQTNDAPMTPDDVRKLKAEWIAARRGKDGGVAFTTAGVEVINHGQPIAELLVDGRNAVAVDIARLCGIPATMIDATLTGSSLSYNNTASRMAELVTFGLAPMMAAIAGRLGMDDMVPRGQRIVFDTAETLAPAGTLNVPDDQDGPADTLTEGTPVV